MYNRRGLLLGAAAFGVSGCKVLDGANEKDSALRGAFESVSNLTYRAQRLLGGGHSMAPEYTQADIRQGQRPNGSTDPDGEAYLALSEGGFSGYTLTVTGLVERPLTLPLDLLKAMPSRTQTTASFTAGRVMRIHQGVRSVVPAPPVFRGLPSTHL